MHLIDTHEFIYYFLSDRKAFYIYFSLGSASSITGYLKVMNPFFYTQIILCQKYLSKNSSYLIHPDCGFLKLSSFPMLANTWTADSQKHFRFLD